MFRIMHMAIDIEGIVNASHSLLFDLVQCSDIHIIASLENFATTTVAVHLFLFAVSCMHW
jgi:hypothetical protein